MTKLIQQDYFQPLDNAGTRKQIRPSDIKSGTYYGQLQLRGSILVIKDNQNTASGYIAFGTDMSTIPTSPTTGTGVYQDYRGIYGNSSGTSQFYLQSSDGKAYAGAGTVKLDGNGITLTHGEGLTSTIKWYDGSSLVGEIWTSENVGNTVVVQSHRVSATTSGETAENRLFAQTHDSAEISQVWAKAVDGGAGAYTLMGGTTYSGLVIGDLTATPTLSDGIGIDVVGKILRLRTSKTPSASSSTGNAGEICWDANYIYVCTATDVWERAAIATW